MVCVYSELLGCFLLVREGIGKSGKRYRGSSAGLGRNDPPDLPESKGFRHSIDSSVQKGPLKGEQREAIKLLQIGTGIGKLN
jgi:hypothetical protein